MNQKVAFVSRISYTIMWLVLFSVSKCIICIVFLGMFLEGCFERNSSNLIWSICWNFLCSILTYWWLFQIQGKFYFRFDPLGEGAKWRRTFGQEIYSPLLLAFAEQVRLEKKRLSSFILVLLVSYLPKTKNGKMEEANPLFCRMVITGWNLM